MRSFPLSYVKSGRANGNIRIMIVAACFTSALFVLPGCSGRHATVAASSDPNTAWLQQKAVECKGDMSKLPMDDQQKLKDLYGFPGAPSRIANAYYQSKGEQ